MIRRWAAAVAVTVTLAACTNDDAEPPGGPDHDTTVTASPELASSLAKARAATARYVDDLGAADAAGYRIITPMMPGMGYHYLNGDIEGFDVTRPPILVYVRNGTRWQLGALEWVWPERPATPPLEGATYGSFDAACHYRDGSFVPAAAEADCTRTSPDGTSPFTFWHPKLVTMHVWLWYHNPAGLYHPTNPLVPDPGEGNGPQRVSGR
ncbi:hypothetical protein GCM10009557_15090 [Virgisporangium ochraceum]|uniref:Lipoprotein n=1 Tax=Virgisporangium ochraceum TaxID=65505 RepID=A0A8J4E8A3_9ACTN|nr:hypothetical protein [Virgisporangium ochraceum]GIJ65139.1 hypothetical protein Voc01_000560 [Virgisporangium ochraceum]